ncbi:tyrosine-type recombinase/integrase [Halobacillus sp. A5]|uniref:tyrosine-type recombinase/integrase n=1 Tax=Halobacillus sp. A5 TaxID=2880263 RepID=UPI0020A63E5B|nr:tyrosine-type recombinase/integrase [Halobacillus sp. A5]MCP3026025.1 tyrosine-type recombinase/integrase [Halobacillus sp. A5]
MELVTDLIEEYLYHCMARGYTAKTMKNKRQEYKQFNTFLKERRGITEVENITVHDMKAYVRSKQLDNLQPQSIVSMAKNVKAFLNWCISEEYLNENPMTKVALPKVPKKVVEGFTYEDVNAMINAFSTKTMLEARNKAIIAMLADCGLRSIEIRSLRVNDVRDSSILVSGKGNKERMVSISPALKKILIRYERLKEKYFEDKSIKADRYFLSYQAGEISHVGLYNVIQRAGELAGIKKRVHPHAFRHFYAVSVLIGYDSVGGLDLYTISRLLGHSETTVTENYLRSITDQQLLDKAVSASPLMNYNSNKR